MASNTRNLFVVSFLLFTIVFFPTYIGGLSLHTGQKFLYLLFPLFICFFLIGRKKIVIPSISIFLIFLFVIFFFTVLSKLEFINIQIALAHFRYLAYFGVFTISYNIAKRFNITLGLMRKALFLLLFAILLFVVIQLVFPEFIVKLGITNKVGIDRLGIRIGGPFVWSYSYGFALLPIFYMIYSSLIKGNASLKLFFLLNFILLTILAGQSKAAYLAYIINFIFFIPLSYKYGNKKYVNFVVLFLLFMGGLLVSYIVANLEEFGNIHRFVSALSNEETDASTQTRLNQLSYIENTIKENILLGYPIEYVVIENGYGYYTYYYGLIGLFSYLSLLAFLFYKTLKMVIASHKSKSFSSNDQTVLMGYLSFIIGAVIFSLANSPLDGHKVAYFFWTLSGLIWGSVSNHNKIISYEDRINK